MKIRMLTKDDYNNYLNLIKDFRDTFFNEQEFVCRLELIRKSLSEIWVIEDSDSKLIATGTVYFEHKYIYNMCILAHLEDICVKKEYRGKGIGKRLCNFLNNRAISMKCYKVTLDCSSENEKFYENCGYIKKGSQMVKFLD